MSAFGRPMTGRRPRMTRAHDRQKTLPLRYPSGGARRACRSPAPRARSAPPSAATSPSPSPSPPPARGRTAPHCSPGTSPPPGLAPGPTQARSAASTGPSRRGDPAPAYARLGSASSTCLLCSWFSVRAFAMYSPFTRRARSATGALRRRCRACGPSWYSSLAPKSVFTLGRGKTNLQKVTNGAAKCGWGARAR